ncbi:glycosyltransferase [Ancylomarina sp. DW003]|nr:glycosyltransferase [Ancylomarina sp. DW003]MDE5423401.1 glycosyltransferase [Ancylomarina sp. DW003]
MTKPLVSIHCITYNHENYIAQALEGFLLQKTNFPIEIVICDDASTDKTANIIREYADKYPNLIVPLLQSENQYSQGVKPGFDIVMPRCQGKYIAHCEGDDYWIDPYKLQKQVNFMEGNPEYSFIFHDCEILNQNSGSRQLRVGKRVIDETVDLVSAIKQNNMPTASILHRNVLDRNSTPGWSFRTKKGDYCLVILLAEKGLGKYLPDVMSVYRVHEGGVWSGNDHEYRNKEDINFFYLLYEYFSDTNVRATIKKRLNYCFIEKAFIKIKKGEIISGLYLYLRHINSINDTKKINEVKKILLAFKAGVFNLARKLSSFFNLKIKKPTV